MIRSVTDQGWSAASSWIVLKAQIDHFKPISNLCLTVLKSECGNWMLFIFLNSSNSTKGMSQQQILICLLLDEWLIEKIEASKRNMSNYVHSVPQVEHFQRLPGFWSVICWKQWKCDIRFSTLTMHDVYSLAIGLLLLLQWYGTNQKMTFFNYIFMLFDVYEAITFIDAYIYGFLW